MAIVICCGVMDPEMKAIIKIAMDHGLGRVCMATVGGKPANPSNVYAADPVPDLCPGDRLVLVECEPSNIPAYVAVERIDHHREGDPGWDKPAWEYWKGSSLGQFADMFGIPANRYLRTLAAMDHCFQAALAGACPYVLPKEVLALKIAAIAKGTGKSQFTVRKFVAHHQRRLNAHTSEVVLGGQRVVDYRPYDLGIGWSVELLTAQVAVALEKRAALLRHRDSADGSYKVTLSGYTSPGVVAAFMRTWAPANGLQDVYGVEIRGYAGGYERSG